MLGITYKYTLSQIVADMFGIQLKEKAAELEARQQDLEQAELRMKELEKKNGELQAS